ncbi:MAG: hypothetical protein ABIT01_01385 [Thermoanaerobaculia bacterium]
MGMVVRFLSGSLLGRDFEFAKDAVRVGDDPDADIRIDPEGSDNAGARNRVIEVLREGTSFRIRSAGNREISSQGDERVVDRDITVGEEIRFGAWGPIFVVSPKVSDDASLSVTTPISAIDPDESSPKLRRKRETITDVRTVSGERPVGPKTVYMMIQDALGKAQGSEGNPIERGTVFIQEMVGDTIQNATRSLKIGLGLLGAAFLVLAFVLVANIASTKKTLATVTQRADSRVAEARTEMAGEMASIKKGRDDLAGETALLMKRLSDIEKSAGGDQRSVSDLKGRLREAEERRQALETKMTKAMAALDADRAALVAEKERLTRERAADVERQRAEAERQKADAAAARVAAAAPVAEPAPAAAPATPR